MGSLAMCAKTAQTEQTIVLLNSCVSLLIFGAHLSPRMAQCAPSETPIGNRGSHCCDMVPANTQLAIGGLRCGPSETPMDNKGGHCCDVFPAKPQLGIGGPLVQPATFSKEGST